MLVGSWRKGGTRELFRLYVMARGGSWRGGGAVMAWRGEKPWQIAIDKSSCPRSPLI